MNNSRLKTSGTLLNIGYTSHEFEHDEIVADLIYLKYLYYENDSKYEEWKSYVENKYGFKIVRYANEILLQCKTDKKMALPLNRIKKKNYNDM